jgi:hypothetical protein
VHVRVIYLQSHTVHTKFRQIRSSVSKDGLEGLYITQMRSQARTHTHTHTHTLIMMMPLSHFPQESQGDLKCDPRQATLYQSVMQRADGKWRSHGVVNTPTSCAGGYQFSCDGAQKATLYQSVMQRAVSKWRSHGVVNTPTSCAGGYQFSCDGAQKAVHVVLSFCSKERLPQAEFYICMVSFL